MAVLEVVVLAGWVLVSLPAASVVPSTLVIAAVDGSEVEGELGPIDVDDKDAVDDERALQAAKNVEAATTATNAILLRFATMPQAS